ncbi:MAG TPA: type VII secretion protein EccE, partial [Gordonia sp. (in: high G+C Gram-positive bacteria)]|nr:type VII secretion protein EccE [Gordonia sp. (in: high G+C Gram-positive bacteria)]
MIVVQIAAGVVLAVWGLSSAAPAAVTGVVAAIVIAGWWCCTQIREARSFWTRILFHINGSRVSVGIPVEFADIPATGGPLTDTLVAGDAQARTVEGIGVSVSPDVLVTVIRVRPASPAVRYLDRTGRDCGPGTEPPLALAPLADCLAQFDIALHSIDVVVHTASAGASGPVSHSYARTLGPIRSTPRTSTFVIVRLDPRNCPEAITRRGGNTEGTARTVAVATSTIALQEQLVRKDLPLLARALPFPVDFTLVKGRGNYLCRRRMDIALEDEEGALVTDEPYKYPSGSYWPAGLTIHPREDLDRVQRDLSEIEGVTVLLYDQTCAAEKRRRRKRGTFPDPDQRVIINEDVCEGCGDCGVQSNCVSVQPL